MAALGVPPDTPVDDQIGAPTAPGQDLTQWTLNRRPRRGDRGNGGRGLEPGQWVLGWPDNGPLSLFPALAARWPVVTRTITPLELIEQIQRAT